MTRELFVCAICFMAYAALGQNSRLLLYEDTLKQLRANTLEAKKDKQRLKANTTFLQTLERALNTEGAFNYPFDSLQAVGRLRSPDNKFRLINWNLPLDNGTQHYFCLVQVYNKNKDLHQTWRLADRSREITAPAKKSLNHENWFGALYYQIIPTKKKGARHYTLLGWDGNDKVSTKKIIDVLYFTGNGKPRFGASIFKYPKKTRKRVVFEYTSQAVMSLKYDEKRQRIIFDHLAPVRPELEGQYQFYGPDLSFDAFELKNEKWYLIPDVDARLEKDKKRVLQNPPKR